MTAMSSIILTSQSTSTYVSLCIILKEPQIAESSYCNSSGTFSEMKQKIEVNPCKQF